MARPVPRTSHRRQARSPPDPEMASGGRSRRRTDRGSWGTGQGAAISPLLANVYLHYVLDLWAERWRRSEAKGDMVIVRYADDAIFGFESETDARRFLDAMRERLAAFALTPCADLLVELIGFELWASRACVRGCPAIFR